MYLFDEKDYNEIVDLVVKEYPNGILSVLKSLSQKQQSSHLWAIDLPNLDKKLGQDYAKFKETLLETNYIQQINDEEELIWYLLLLEATYNQTTVLKIAERFVKTWEDWPKVVYKIGLCAEFINQDVIARGALEKSILIDPNFQPPYMVLGSIYGSEGRDEDALNAYSLAIQLDPEDHFARSNYAMWCVQTGNLKEAIKQIEESLKINPKDAEGWAQYSSILNMNGKTKAAKNAMKKAKELGFDFSKLQY